MAAAQRLAAERPKKLLIGHNSLPDADRAPVPSRCPRSVAVRRRLNLSEKVNQIARPQKKKTICEEKKVNIIIYALRLLKLSVTVGGLKRIRYLPLNKTPNRNLFLFF